jgi:ketol-acid reductoisomerase
MATLYFDKDADLSVLENKTIAIIGYGNQGRAQALNLKDSGFDSVIVGSSKDPAQHQATKDGFNVLSIADTSKQADIIFILIPDEVMPSVYKKEIEPYLEKGNVLNFASGYNITFKHIVPPSFVDVVMIAPRMIGDGVRQLYLSKEGYPAFIAIEQDATGQAKTMALALAKAIGATQKGCIEVTFRDETMLDLLAEQAIWPLITAVLTEAFKFEVEKGHPAEASLVELYLSKEPAYMFEKMADEGLFKQLPYHSHTSQYGQLSRFEKLDKQYIRTVLEKAYAYIENGSFAKEWEQEQEKGLPEFQRLLDQAFKSDLSQLEEKLLSSGSPAGNEKQRVFEDHLLTEHHIRQAKKEGVESIRIATNTLVTPMARDAAGDAKIKIQRI